MKKIAIGVIFLSTLVLAGCNKYTSAPTSSSRSQESTTTGAALEASQVVYDGSSFSPGTITVKKGTRVTWTNNSSSGMWVASNPHPTHTGLAGLDALKSAGKGETYTFTFEKVGTFGYHNHLSPSVGGTVRVEE